MDRHHAGSRYSSTFVESRVDGYAGMRLHLERDGASTVVAEVIFWDAAGQFYVTSFGHEVPLSVLEELIAVARQRVRVE